MALVPSFISAEAESRGVIRKGLWLSLLSADVRFRDIRGWVTRRFLRLLHHCQPGLKGTENTQGKKAVGPLSESAGRKH